jgi:hypothetical protein
MRLPYSGAYGFTVRAGLEQFDCDAVAVMMADGSDDPRDLLLYHQILERGYDCTFGSRFVPGATVREYPKIKLVINSVVNFGTRRGGSRPDRRSRPAQGPSRAGGRDGAERARRAPEAAPPRDTAPGQGTHRSSGESQPGEHKCRPRAELAGSPR